MSLFNKFVLLHEENNVTINSHKLLGYDSKDTKKVIMNSKLSRDDISKGYKSFFKIGDHQI